MTGSPIWVDSSPQAEEAMARIRAWPHAGFDTEFTGCDITEESPVRRAVCYSFQVAVPDGPLTPRGYNEATNWVFAGHLLTEPCVQDWLEDPAYTKCAHNQPVESHVCRNHGVLLRGGCNTLDMARWWYPERAKREGFDLDGMGEFLCGVGKTESFSDLLGYTVEEYREVEVTKKRCACGELGCTKKKAPHDVKTPEQVWVARPHKVKKLIPLTDLSPTHRLWARFLDYAARDALLALWIWQIMMRDGRRARPYPWRMRA